MTWRREDYGYAVATLAAVAFVAYLIAGNFGLVPSPLGRGRTDGLPQTEVAALAFSNLDGRTLPTPSIAPVPAPIHREGREDRSPLPAKPTIEINTKSGTQVTLAQKATVIGRIFAPAGYRAVIVSFKQTTGNPADVVASPSCYEPGKCTWSVPVPTTLGTYQVRAGIVDKLGRAAMSNTITITVVNAGNVVGGVVNGVGNTVNGVGTLLTNAPNTLTGAVNNLLGLLHL